jgi:amyloid beta precursor protein binding protein 1
VSKVTFVFNLWLIRCLSARAPFSELPNTAAFLGGMVAQEVIKMITKQYVPVKGYCVINLIETSTGTIGA